MAAKTKIPPGYTLKFLREEKKMSQKRLGDLAGCSQAQVDRLEKGLRYLDQEWAEKFARALGCHWTDLMDEMPSAQKLSIKLADRIQGLPEGDRDAVQHIVDGLARRRA